MSIKRKKFDIKTQLPEWEGFLNGMKKSSDRMLRNFATEIENMEIGVVYRFPAKNAKILAGECMEINYGGLRIKQQTNYRFEKNENEERIIKYQIVNNSDTLSMTACIDVKKGIFEIVNGNVRDVFSFKCKNNKVGKLKNITEDYLKSKNKENKTKTN